MLEIRPLEHLDATVRVPGSKSLTQRALIIAALADGESRLKNGLLCEDTEILTRALGEMGIAIRTEGTGMTVCGNGGKLARPSREIALGSNGTAMRLLAGIASLGAGPVVLTGGKRLCERPMQPLLEALTVLGATIRTDGKPGHPPVTLLGGGLKGGRAVLRNIGSSQYVSSLLIAAPYAARDVSLVLEGKIPSLPYIALTAATMADFGVQVLVEGPGRYVIPSGQRYRAREYRIEGDVSSASYFFAAAALLKGQTRVEPIDPRTGQGDIVFLEILERLGCRIARGNGHVVVAGGEPPRGELTFDLGAIPDMAPTLAVLCARRPGRSLIRNVAHLRLKESDRLAVLVNELRKTGVGAEELPDGIAITGGSPHGASIETYDDHRIAMSFAILGLAVPGMRIGGEDCVRKSFPGFWQALEGLYRNDRIAQVA